MASPVHRFASEAVSIDASPELTAMAEAMSKNMRPHWVEKAAAMLGVSSESLVKLQVGWSAEHRAMSFPMRDAAGGVIGIRLRCPQTARKWAVPGSKRRFVLRKRPLRHWPICKSVCHRRPDRHRGPVVSGLNVIGVPSAGGSAAMLAKIIRRLSPTDVVVVADSDDAGKGRSQSIGRHIIVDSVNTHPHPAQRFKGRASMGHRRRKRRIPRPSRP